MHQLNEAEEMGNESDHEVEHKGETDCEKGQRSEGIQRVELQKHKGETQKREFCKVSRWFEVFRMELL
jgi:hypothetical protein